jgi:soluble lytic murein transglycosylase-like protein
MIRARLPRLLPAIAATVALALPAASPAAEQVPTPSTTSAGSPAPAGASAPTAQAPATSTARTETSTIAIPAPPAPAPRPQVQAQHSQGATPGAPARPGAASHAGGSAESREGSGTGARATRPAPAPSTLTPQLPLGLQSSIAGVPGFFIESFQIPPFLLPIFQAAGTAYGIPWQVLAAINEVETDYGRDLSVSSAGAEGWMQFLPAEWAQYGVDANGDGFRDPYNPADAIFAAARYLRAAGGQGDIRAAVFSYNHSASYVDSVTLRAQLLGGTPPEMLGAITGLTEARFPVHARSHFTDGFPTVTPSGSNTPQTLAATTIYSQAGAPVIAVQDGEIVQIGDSPTLGRYVSLRDAFGNTYVYAELGDVASLYPVLQPHVHSTVSPRIAQGAGRGEPAPSGPATAGAQARSPLSEGATVSGLALGAAAGLEAAPGSATTTSAPAASPVPARKPSGRVSVFREGSNDVYLHPLRAGVQVIAGTVLGHVGAGASAGGGSAPGGEPHIIFQIRPDGAGAPQIDPKPILDGWVALENSSIFRAKGENPFLATSPSTGQVLLESKQQLEPQVLRDGGIHLDACGREAVQAGRVDKRVLALLEYLSVSGLKPTASGLRCAGATPAAVAANAAASTTSVAVDITSINGVPIAGHGSQVADTALRALLALQGAARPQRIVSPVGVPGARNVLVSPGAGGAIRVAFSRPGAAAGRTAGLLGSALTPSGWIKLIARLGEIPDPSVARAPSPAAIPDTPGVAHAGSGTETHGNG